MARARKTASMVSKRSTKLNILKPLRRAHVIPITMPPIQIPSGRKQWSRRRVILKKLFGYKKMDARAVMKQEYPGRRKLTQVDSSIPRDVVNCVNDLISSVEILEEEPRNFCWTFPENRFQHTKCTRVRYFEIQNY